MAGTGKVVDNLRPLAIGCADRQRGGAIERNPAYIVKLCGMDKQQAFFIEAKNADLVLMDIKELCQFNGNLFTILYSQTFRFTVNCKLRQRRGKCGH